MPGGSLSTLASRFWSKVDKTTGHGPNGDCWIWTAASLPHGYGLIGLQGKNSLAHRVAWFLHYGQWPTLKALHRCDTPACVRWEHLFEGTQGENISDSWEKKRRGPRQSGLEAVNRAKTHCPQGHEYNEKNARIKAKGRQCRVCDRDRQREIRKLHSIARRIAA